VSAGDAKPLSDSSSAKRGARQALSEIVRLFWSVADSYTKQRLLLALVLVGIGALLAALTPIALKLVIDSLSQPRSVDAAFVGPIALVILYAFGQYATRAFTELRTMLHGHAEQRVRRRIGLRLFEHLVRLPLQFHLDRKAGAMGETAEQGLRGFDLLLQHLVYTVVPISVEFATVTIVLVHFDQARYLLILGLASVAYVAAFHWCATAIQAPAASMSKLHVDSHALLTDTLINSETIKYFDAEPVVCEQYDLALGRKESAWRRFFVAYATGGVLVATIFGLSLGISLVCAARDVMTGAMSLGDFVLVNAYVIRLVQPLEFLGQAVRDIAQGLAFLGSMLGLFRLKTECLESRSVENFTPARGALVFDKVSFSYRQETSVLNNVSFEVPAGKTVAVVGVSGSGKSSLIRLLFRLYEPDSGRILLDSIPIQDLALSSVRQAIAVVPQDTVLFHDTIARNIGFGRFGSTQAQIEEAARIANLHPFISRLPEGYETVVGERGLKLSGGERQRIAIARAALKRPRIFVFDEATSSLDSKTEREILCNLLALSLQSTTLVIAHRLSTIVHADGIIVLDRGIVVERGTHEELLALGGPYAALWNAQQSSFVDGASAPVM